MFYVKIQPHNAADYILAYKYRQDAEDCINNTIAIDGDADILSRSEAIEQYGENHVRRAENEEEASVKESIDENKIIAEADAEYARKLANGEIQ